MTFKRLALCCTILLAFAAVEIGPANADLLNDIKRGARKTGNALERGAKKVGRAVEEGVDDTGRALKRGGRSLHNGFCRTFTDKSNAQCRAESGVGYDKKGTYTYDPKNPKKKYRGDDSDPKATERDQHLSKFAAYVKNKELTPAEIEDRDTYKFRRFLLPNAKLGEGFPEKAKLVAPTKSGEVRACCLAGGGGSFLDDRLDKSKLRFYGGTDFLTKPGDPVTATIDGWIETEKAPRDGFDGVTLRDEAGYRSSIYFVDLTPEIKKALADKSKFEVKAGETVLGKAQDLHPAYPADMPNHVHVVMSDPKGNPIDPMGKLLLERAPKSIPEKKPERKAPEATAKP